MTLKHVLLYITFALWTNRYPTGRWQRNGQRRVTGSKSCFCGTSLSVHAELAVHCIQAVVAVVQLLVLATASKRQLLGQLLEQSLEALLKLAVSSAQGNSCSVFTDSDSKVLNCIVQQFRIEEYVLQLT
jgi:hypothetical protein